jgi:hypothetical protein
MTCPQKKKIDKSTNVENFEKFTNPENLINLLVLKA